jgi:hypothetical protein
MKRDRLYEKFYDPTQAFSQEPRALCYDLARSLIRKAMNRSERRWYHSDDTAKAILLLLYTWNFAARETKRLNRGKLLRLLRSNEADLRRLERYTILSADKEAWPIIRRVFARFKKPLGQTGASKALSLPNPRLFVMWDTAIRQRLRKQLVPGIANGQKPSHYTKFLKGTQENIRTYEISKKLKRGSIVAKKLDEFHYAEIVLRKRSGGHRS